MDARKDNIDQMLELHRQTRIIRVFDVTTNLGPSQTPTVAQRWENTHWCDKSKQINGQQFCNTPYSREASDRQDF